jgi:DNA repair protein RadC
MTKDENLHDGHRERVREKYREHGLKALTDHEVLEMLLYYVIPRKNTNPTGHLLLDTFGSIAGVFAASENELLRVPGIGKEAVLFLKSQHELLLRYQKGFHEKKTDFKSHKACIEYVCEKMRYLLTEEVHLLCLDSGMNFIKYIPLFKGSVNATDVRIRELTSKTLEANASAVVLAHNHTSGVLHPSPDDIILTETVMTALRYQSVDLVDHLIVTPNGFLSLMDEGVIKVLREKINRRLPNFFAAESAPAFKD